ncbi:hypothetical protein BH11BAC3_BH11BAC3_04780 [soil metagenome]
MAEMNKPEAAKCLTTNELNKKPGLIAGAYNFLLFIYSTRLGYVAVFENRQPVTAAKFINKIHCLH